MAVFTFQPNDILRTTINYRYGDGTRCVLTLHHRVAAAPLPAGATSVQFLARISSLWQTVMTAGICNNVASEDIRVVTLSPITGRGGFFDAVTTGFAGGVNSPALPPSDALVYKRLTALVGPKNRGRVYICGLPTAAQTNGAWNLALPLFAGLTPAVASLISGDIADVNQNVIANPVLLRPQYQGNPPNRIFIGFDPLRINGIGLNLYVRSQRRRQPGVGM